jgi:hypothetical protein
LLGIDNMPPTVMLPMPFSRKSSKSLSDQTRPDLSKRPPLPRKGSLSTSNNIA